MNKKLTAYLVLLVLLGLGLVLFLVIPPVAGKKEAAILTMTALYVGWSLWYHGRRGDLTYKIVVEYILVAVLGGLLLFSLLN